jgi:hypothetical protein
MTFKKFPDSLYPLSFFFLFGKMGQEDPMGILNATISVVLIISVLKPWLDLICNYVAVASQCTSVPQRIKYKLKRDSF